MAELLEVKKRSAFYGWPMAIFLAGMLVFAIHASSHMVAAGDTWVAMACGRHHATHGVNCVEPFSANSHEAGPTEESIKHWPGWAQKLASGFDIETIRKWHPTGWVNQNWLTHTTFYWLAKTFGDDGEYNYDALVYWKFAIYIIEVLCVYYIGRLIGASVPGSAVAAAFALFVGRTFLDIRPAGYANLLSVLFLLVIALSVYRDMRYIWFLVPITVFWSNVHGGYIYVFIMMVPFIGIQFLGRLSKKFTLGLMCIGGWSFLYLLSYQFISNSTYRIIRGGTYVPVGMFSDTTFRFLTIMIAITVVLLLLKDLKPTVLYVYSLLGSVIFMLFLLQRMSVAVPSDLMPKYAEKAKEFVTSSNLSFYFFLIFLVFLAIALTFRKENLVVIKSKAIVLSICAVVAAFFAMVLFNPYHLTNLTHTFEISVSEHAESWRSVNEWHPAFEWKNPVGDEEAFLVMYIIGWVALAVWFGVRFIRPRVAVKRRGQMGEYAEGSYQWPKIDLAIITIAALSTYMAIRSRRFIPIAATAACPLIALFFEQAVGMVLVKIRYNKRKVLELPAFDPRWRKTVILVFGVAVLVFGFGWGAKYKRIYLDPWPTDDIRDSVFMRMTASNIKPFDVSQFIRENELSGNMFNYWTEGGALAFGQEPDPETGTTPLQLFMDGRAQAAYDHATFMEWRRIYGGGDVATRVRSTSANIANAEKMKEIGADLTAIMKKDDIWIFVLPTREFSPKRNPRDNNYYPLALSRHPDWRVAYADDYQMLYVNITMAKGKEVYGKLLAGDLKFPTAMSENYTLAKNYLVSRDVKIRRKGFEVAKKAFELDNSQGPMHQIAYEVAGRWPEFQRDAAAYIAAYVKKFTDNKEELFRESGYSKKLGAARIGARYLSGAYRATNKKLSDEYSRIYDELSLEGGELALAYKW